jgi:hypothetical protein
MNEEPTANNLKDLENPEKIIDEIDSVLGDLKARFIEGAIHFGQAQERIQKIRPEWERLSTIDVSTSDQAEIYVSGMYALSNVQQRCVLNAISSALVLETCVSNPNS